MTEFRRSASVDALAAAVGLDVPDGMSGMSSVEHAEHPIVRASRDAMPLLSLLGAQMQAEHRLPSAMVANILTATLGMLVGEIFAKHTPDAAGEVEGLLRELGECLTANALLSFRAHRSGLHDIAGAAPQGRA
jgi:hypothetical protein